MSFIKIVSLVGFHDVDVLGGRVHSLKYALCALCSPDSFRGACAEIMIPIGATGPRILPVCYDHAHEVANWLVEAAEELLKISEATRVAIPAP